MNEELSNHGLVDQPMEYLPVEPWVRNPEWLAIPEVLPSERKIVMLARIDPGLSNYAAFQITVVGGFTVNWGDGNIVNYSSAATALKQYDFDAVTATVTSEGYKQVIITITPTILTNTITAAVLNTKHTATGLTGHVALYQDMIISLPGTTGSFFLGSSGTLNPSFEYLERVQLIASALTSYANLFGDLVSLRSVSVTSSAVVTNMSYMFQNCIKLQQPPDDLPYSTATNTSYMFQRCREMKSLNIPSIATASTNCYNMFGYCSQLQWIPPITFTTAGTVDCSYMFTFCIKLIEMPSLTWEKANTLASICAYCSSLTRVPPLNITACTSLTSAFSNCISLKSIGTLTTSTSLTTIASTFATCSTLTSLPQITTTSAVTSFSAFANACTSIESCPVYDTSSNTTFSSAFQGCNKLRDIPTFNYTKCTSVISMFSGCAAIRKIGTLDFGTTTTGSISAGSFIQMSNAYESRVEEIGPLIFPSTLTSVTIGSFALNGRMLQKISIDCTKVASTAGIASIFNGSQKLTSVILTGLRFGAFSIAGAMQVPALVALFESLGTASGAQTLTVSGNPGWSLLSAADKLIATSKGWTLA